MTDLRELTEEVVANYSEDLPLKGIGVVLWGENNTIGVAYAGEVLNPLGLADLMTNGVRSVLQNLQQKAIEAQAALAAEQATDAPNLIVLPGEE
jgi:hypothetical protein